MEPDHLKEFVSDANSTRAEIEAKTPGIVERAQAALDQKRAVDALKAVEESKEAIEQMRPPKPKKRASYDREF